MSDLDPDLPIGSVTPMVDVVSRTRTTSELAALIAIALSAIATLLAAIGLYSLLAHEVLRRQHEIGIRMALGAGRGSILALVGRQSLRLALLGTSIGLLATWWLVRFLEGFLYQVEPYDPTILAVAFGTMVLTVIAASLLPMLRASKSDPVAVLREAS